LKWRDVREK
jgi:hypothetical protein